MDARSLIRESTMNGYQVTFFTQQDQQHEGVPVHEWIERAAQELGVRGSTVIVAATGRGHGGKLHSAHFFELADQPVETVLAMTATQTDQLFARIQQAQVTVFYVKTVVEFGVLGSPDVTAP